MALYVAINLPAITIKQCDRVSLVIQCPLVEEQALAVSLIGKFVSSFVPFNPFTKITM